MAGVNFREDVTWQVDDATRGRPEVLQLTEELISLRNTGEQEVFERGLITQ